MSKNEHKSHWADLDNAAMDARDVQGLAETLEAALAGEASGHYVAARLLANRAWQLAKELKELERLIYPEQEGRGRADQPGPEKAPGGYAARWTYDDCPIGNTDFEERLRKTDRLSYLCHRLHCDDPDFPEEEVLRSNMMDVLEKCIDPKWEKIEVLTIFENFCADYGRVCEAHGFKLGAGFTVRFFEDIKHPYYMSETEAEKEYEHMTQPIELADDDEDDEVEEEEGD